MVINSHRDLLAVACCMDAVLVTPGPHAVAVLTH